MNTLISVSFLLSGYICDDVFYFNVFSWNY